TFNIAPVWTRLISTTTLFTFGGFVRQDRFNYYPSGDVFADGTGLIPGGSSATLNQQRKLTNAGLRSDVSYVKGKHNVKAGVTFQHTFLTENFNFGVTDPAFNAVCLNAADASPFTSPTPTFLGNCTGALEPNDGTDTRATERTRVGSIQADCIEGRVRNSEVEILRKERMLKRDAGFDVVFALHVGHIRAQARVGQFPLLIERCRGASGNESRTVRNNVSTRVVVEAVLTDEPSEGE